MAGEKQEQASGSGRKVARGKQGDCSVRAPSCAAAQQPSEAERVRVADVTGESGLARRALSPDASAGARCTQAVSRGGPQSRRGAERM